ncbi:type II secretion system protein GspD [Aeoliella mucimassa]|nr:general secretion pathway protein GspD [Aeoliella mucimassa]
MSRKVLVVLGLGLSTCLAGVAQAQSTTTAATANTPLSREQVDQLLVQAKAAIGAGDLKKADSLITQAEGADVRYPMFHFGDTPGSLRRDLMQAQANNQDPFNTPGPPVAQAPTTPMVDPAVTPASATSPYGIYREEPSDSIPGLDLAPVQLPPVGYPATATPATQPQNTPYSGLDISAPSDDNRYANPVGMMQTNEDVQAQANNLPGISEMRFAQAPATSAQALLDAGEQALKSGNREQALSLFRKANESRGTLDTQARGRLDGHLRILTAAPEPLELSPVMSNVSTPAVSETLPNSVATANSREMDMADGERQVLVRQLSADVGRVQLDAKQLRETDPKQALKALEDLQAVVNKSQLGENDKRVLQHRLSISINETEQYIQQHRADLELDERNREILAEIDRRMELKLQMQDKIGKLVDEFNKLRDDHRYHEMELVAQQLTELAPEDPTVMQIQQTAKFIRREFINNSIAEQKENGFWQAISDVESASIATTSDNNEVVYDVQRWRDLVQERGRNDRNRNRSPKEIEIEASLRKPVMVRFQNEPLAAVIDDLSKATGVNMVLDLRGLNQEGVSSDTRVSLNVNGEISLKSALNLILEQFHLGYVVKDEVLKITSETLKDTEQYTLVYDVADLVIPIPNFVPDNNMGLQGLINSAHAAMGYGAGSFGHGPMSFVNGNNPDPNGVVPPTALAQPGMGASGAGLGSPTTLPIGGGPGGMGGAANADFDSLIDLIISTVASDTWVENGGPEAEIRPFPTNLSLVISQTQDVHEQIADLLEQLRRLQDLQVTIEVRFIRLSDSFFERIGIDFDMNIENKDPEPGTFQPGQAYEGETSSAVVGLIDGEFPNFTNDLDIPLRQGSYALAVPQFGSPQDVASFGFAILSDIEAYFLISASQGDQRSNLLNAPKVTLFNGQQAFVADTTQRPFVISVVPVVGEFAAAQQPVIVVLSEGTLMSIQAVVSEDRRYVRLTVVPFFSQIGDVQEFTFEGSTSTSTSSSTTDDNDGTSTSANDAEDIVRSGTTVQLPEFSFISVTTTVSVPDGGTVLLGGIKRLNEGRNEFGVPLLSKMPYINRLFRNVGIGRETDSLMMMVTPRIIIQEEEEAKLMGTPIGN